VAIRAAIRAGGIGRPSALRIVYGCWLGRDWAAGAGGGPNWRIDARQAGGGAMMDLAPHGLDLVDALLGEPIVELVGLTQRRVQDYAVEDGGMLVGATATGILVSLHNSYNTPETLPRRRLEIVGTRGQIVGTDTMGQTPGGDVAILDATDGAATRLDFDRRASPFAAQARAFAAAVRGGPHAFDAMRDLAAMRLLAPFQARAPRAMEPAA
jgi:predicted dehydrogenase